MGVSLDAATPWLQSQRGTAHATHVPQLYWRDAL
jgi:hypothetical protein